MHLTFSLIVSSEANWIYIRIFYNRTIWPLEIEISISIGIYTVSVSPKSVHEKLSTWVPVVNNQYHYFFLSPMIKASAAYRFLQQNKELHMLLCRFTIGLNSESYNLILLLCLSCCIILLKHTIQIARTSTFLQMKSGLDDLYVLRV